MARHATARAARVIRFCRPTGRTKKKGNVMSKGLNQKKDAKKKPAKSLKEKRAEKQAKKSK
jgi:hypothetical protein